jgi:glutaminase
MLNVLRCTSKQAEAIRLESSLADNGKRPADAEAAHAWVAKRKVSFRATLEKVRGLFIRCGVAVSACILSRVCTQILRMLSGVAEKAKEGSNHKTVAKARFERARLLARVVSEGQPLLE